MAIGKIISLVLILAVLVVVGLAAAKPDEFRVSRSAVMAAPAQDIFAQIVDLEKSQQWSPWVEMDPDAKYEFEGPTVGEGATIHWEGEKSGKGSMIITETRAAEFAKFRLEFEKPMQGTNTAEFTLAPADNGAGTLVTWSMYGPNNFLNKLISVFMNCEKMVGEQFEKGLSNLKTKVEA